jgi:hypothetical protein
LEGVLSNLSPLGKSVDGHAAHIRSKDIDLELPVAVFHPATLPPPPPEPYPYPAPDAYADLFPNPTSSASPPPPLPTPAPILYADRANSLLYAYPAPSPGLPLLPQQTPAPLNAQLVIPPYRAYNGQLWFPSPPPVYGGGPYHNQQYPPPRPASANIGVPQASVLPVGLSVPNKLDELHSRLSFQQQGHYPLQPEQSIGHGARAARISHHLRATSRGRSASPPAQITPPTPVA